MKYKVSFSENGKYVRIRALEAITGEIEKRFAEIAITEARKRKVREFLVDVRGTPNIASSLEQYLFGYEDMDRFGLDRGSRIAVLADANDKSHDFIETVLVNAGYHCCLFTDDDAASDWLGE